MGCFSNDPPPTPNYGQITRDTLQAQVDLAPQQYASEAQYQPLYSNLELNNLNTLLNGTPGGPQNYQSQMKAGQTGWYDASGSFLSPGVQQMQPPAQPGYSAAKPDPFAMLRGNAGGRGFANSDSSNPGIAIPGAYTPGTAPQAGAVWRQRGSAFDVTKTMQTAPQQGLFSMLRQQNTDQRTADISDVANLGPQAAQAMLAADPYNATLLAKLNAQANEGLDAGSMLTADEQRAMQQESRAAFAARGMGGSNGAVADELLKQFNLGQTLLRQRQQFAQGVLGNNQAVIGDPFSQILGRNSGAVPLAQQSQAQAGPQLFNPMSGLGLAASNYATQSQFAAAQPTGMQKVGQVTGIVGGLLGGIGGAI